jgi:alpha-L-arabinofuranosidase
MVELSRPTRRGLLLGALGAAVAPAAAAFAAPTNPSDAVAVAVDVAHPGHRVSPELFGVFFEEINFGGVGGLYSELVRNRAFMDPATPARWITAGQLGRVLGEFGTALALNGSSAAQYVALPAGIVAGLADFTIAVWVNPAALPTWARVFDLGTGPNVNMFLTVNSGAAPRYAITVGGNGVEQRLTAPGPLTAGRWAHLAVTLAGSTGTLYVDGAAVAVNPAMTLTPAALGATTQNWIGRSQYPGDPFLTGAVDEFQIFSRALSAAEVRSLTTSAAGSTAGGDVAWYRFDEAGGGTAVDSSGAGHAGTIALVTSDWEPVGPVTATLDLGTPLNTALPRSLRLDLAAVPAGQPADQRAGMANGGYFGVPAVGGQTYQVSFFAKADHNLADHGVPVTVALEKADGSRSLASTIVPGVTGRWRRHTGTLRVPRGEPDSTDNRIVIGVDPRHRHGTPAGTPAGTLWLQVVSVFPPTYRHRPNGLRPDLVELLAAMRPRILRFPGGNYVEGVTPDTRFDWKATVGPVWERPGHLNSAWNYWSDDGLGLLEFLRLAEDLGATPVIGVYAGLSLDGQVTAEADLAPYVQDALDELEYAIGPVGSPWGARRAADGHPRPFRTPHVEIGNEDNLNGGGASYAAYRYAAFYDAITAAYPQVTVVATAPVTNRPVPVNDEHYYSSPQFFVSQATRYDGYDRSGPRVFVGEYAARSDATGLPTGRLDDSIGEAAFMTGLERNSDIVRMSSYAPLFANVGHTQWNPDLIGFDQLTSFGSTSYWVQRLFATNLGDRVLPVTAGAGLLCSATVDSRRGTVYLKLVNPAGTDLPVTLALSGSTATTATAQVLADPDPTAGNTLAGPERVVPRTATVTGTAGTFTLVAPANSLTVLRVRG